MRKMVQLNQNPTINCTSALPKANTRRDVRSAPINARA